MRQRYLDLGGPAEHFKLLHGGHAANVAVATKASSKWDAHVYAHDVAYAMAVQLVANGSDLDVFQSQNGFAGGRRTNDTVAAIPGLFVDLDYYKVDELRDLHPEELLDRVIDAHPWLPVPTMVIGSGRGAYFAWLFPRPLNRDLLPRWQSVENVLVAMLAPFGADANAKDAARVLRVVGSVNQRNGATVTGGAITGGAVTFATMERLVLAKGFAAARAAVPADARPQTSTRPQAASEAQRAQHLRPLQLASDRMHDLRTLATLRGLPVTDYRARMAFAFACAAVWYTTEEDALAAEIVGFAAEHFEGGEGYGLKQVATVLDRMRQDRQGIARIWNGQRIPNRYRVSNRYIIELLAITPAEQAHMRCIIGREERQIRRTARRRAAGMVDRQAVADDRRQRVFALLQGGWTQTAIAAELGVSRPWVCQIVAAIRKAAERERSTL